MEKALVLGDDTRSFLAIVRSLGRKGVAVHAAPTNFRSVALKSKYIAAVHDLPPWMGDGASWLTAIINLLAAEKFDLVIPCNETALLPLQRHRAALSRETRLAIPDDDAIEVLFDKHETRTLAQRVGVPVAAGRLYKSDDTPTKIFDELGAPIVVKPRRSYLLERIWSRGKVHVARSVADLQPLLTRYDSGDIILEHFVEGDGIGVSVLANHGRVLQAFEHHRVREIEGASFYRCSASLNPEICSACERMIRFLGYTGIAMFEFKVNDSGAWVLLEVNARPWGSMPLPVALGVDFPYRWYQLLVHDKEILPTKYRIKVRGRNLVLDLQQWLSLLHHQKFLLKAQLFIQLMGELAHFVLGREVHDVLARDDPRPGVLELLRLGQMVGRRTTRYLPGAQFWRVHRVRKLSVSRLSGGQHSRIMFVCQGNICRSPFAERLLRQQVGDESIVISSAGMIPQVGRASPPVAVRAAAAHLVDLSDHRSRWLTREDASLTSIFVVFDELTRSALLDRYPDTQHAVVPLGDFVGFDQIVDPINLEMDDFQRVYDQIAAAVTELTAVIRQCRSQNIISRFGPI